MKRYIRASKNLSVSAIGKFIDDAVKSLEDYAEDGEYGYTFYYDLDPDLRLYVGWSGGFEDDNGNDGYEICAKIATAHDALIEYEWMDMPYDEESGEVWDTNMSNPSSQDADWYLEQYEAIREAYDNGELVITGARKR